MTKIHWSACPVAWKGQFDGKEGYPTIGLEAIADNNLWIWHNAFGFPVSLNDINIWDRLPLFESILYGTHANIDFKFNIDGHEFDQLYYLVDGIYPSLSRFLATINNPTTTLIASMHLSRKVGVNLLREHLGFGRRNSYLLAPTACFTIVKICSTL